VNIRGPNKKLHQILLASHFSSPSREQAQHRVKRSELGGGGQKIKKLQQKGGNQKLLIVFRRLRKILTYTGVEYLADQEGGVCKEESISEWGKANIGGRRRLSVQAYGPQGVNPLLQ